MLLVGTRLSGLVSTAFQFCQPLSTAVGNMPRSGKMRHRLHANPFSLREALPKIDQMAMFGREAPLALDVGCGQGLFTENLAKKHPEWNCIGNEIRVHYVEDVEEKRERSKLTNLRGLFANANLQLVNMLPDDSIVFFTHNFPDPWFKKRHEKRRVLNTRFLYDIRPKLKDGCELHIMTDYKPIGESMQKALMETSFLRPLRGNHDFIAETTTGIFSEREITHQEKRNEPIWRMAYVYDASLPVVEPPMTEKERKRWVRGNEAGEDGESDESDSENENAAGESSTGGSKRKRSKEDDAAADGSSSSKKQAATSIPDVSAVKSIDLAAPADFHVHLRQGAMSELIAPHVAEGGVSLGYVMPNLTPPITTVDAAVEYHTQLKKISPGTNFWMTLYLHPSLTAAEIGKAKASGIVKGVKSYPRGVTTNSEGGIESYETYYPVFEAMQEHDLVLNLHGEVPSDAEKDITVLNAEATFLSHLHKIHKQFPKLRIVLEHATTRVAVEAVKQCGETVACSITPHHLELIVDDWAGKPLNFCKPVAKLPDDRRALREVIASGHPRFFLGSDSAPHPLANKYPSAATLGGAENLVHNCGCAAGIYTSIRLIPLCATLLESFGALHQLENYVSNHGRRFYQVPVKEETPKLKLVRSTSEKAQVPLLCIHPDHVSKSDAEKDKLQVVPFWAGKTLGWEIA
ncbi:unnamed protein product [Sympodiomycopsis kandeliae]